MMDAEQERKEREERVYAFESAVVNNDLPKVKKMLEEGFKYERSSWPRTSYNHILQNVVQRGHTQMYFLLKQHGHDFRYVDNDTRYLLKVEIMERDIRFSTLQEELKATKAEVTALRDVVTGLSQKLEELIRPKLDKPRLPLKR
jgi:hypothetical protein